MRNLIDYFIGFFLGFLLGIKIPLLLIGIVFFLDTFFKIISLKKQNIKLDYKEMFNGLLFKMWFYTPLVLFIHAIDIYFLGDLFYQITSINNIITLGVTSIILGTELISIDKHSKIILGKSFKESGSILADGLMKVKNYIRELIGK